LNAPPLFALIGAAGYIAPRHMKAIRAVGGSLAVAYDPNDSVGVMDSHFPDAAFFTAFEPFDAHVARRMRSSAPLNWVAICSPNHLHRPHTLWGLERGLDVVCEKPLVLAPAEIDEIEEMERLTGRRVATILQLRLHPSIQALRERVAASGRRFAVDLTYVTSRGAWYHASWKGDEAKSGGVATNIGVHFFDMLTHVFGPMRRQVSHLNEPSRAAGLLDLERADVRWFLSVDRADLPEAVRGQKTTFRSITMDGEAFEFSEGFTDLHDKSYSEILAGRGFPVAEVRPSIDIVSAFRNLPVTASASDAHPAVGARRA